MTIHVVHQRLRYRKDRTPGEATIAGERVCFLLEDELRERPGVPVEQWKVKTKTAIAALVYEAVLVDSPRFGKDTLTLKWRDPTTGDLKDPPGFKFIRVHGGNSEEDTDGCPLAGAELTTDDKIPGGKSQPALRKLRERLVPAIKAGEVVIWDVRNPPDYTGPPAEEVEPEDSSTPDGVGGASSRSKRQEV